MQITKTAYTQRTAPETLQPPAAKAPARRVGKIRLAIMALCLSVALLCVLLAPLLLGGVSAVSAAGVTAGPVISAKSNTVSYTSAQQALEDIGITAALPTNLPAGCTVISCQVADGAVLELGIRADGGALLFRAAAGSDDLSGADHEQFTYSTTETVDEITRKYAGASDKKLNLAVWVQGTCSYALVSDGGIAAALMRQIAESIV